jgi:hypothetical protein
MKKLLIAWLTMVVLLAGCGGGAAAAFPTGSLSMQNRDDHVIEFTDDGKFVYYIDGEIETSGTYSVQGSVLTWETDSTCDAFNANPATYEWTYEDGVLAFTLKGEDRCSDRKAVLHLMSYVKEP